MAKDKIIIKKKFSFFNKSKEKKAVSSSFTLSVANNQKDFFNLKFFYFLKRLIFFLVYYQNLRLKINNLVLSNTTRIQTKIFNLLTSLPN